MGKSDLARGRQNAHFSSDPGPENKSVLGENPEPNTPPPTDRGDVVPLWYSFDFVKKRVEEGQFDPWVTQHELPSSKDIAGVNMRLTAGSYRELHWPLPTNRPTCCTEKLGRPYLSRR